MLEGELESSRDSGAPMQKWMPLPKARWSLRLAGPDRSGRGRRPRPWDPGWHRRRPRRHGRPWARVRVDLRVLGDHPEHALGRGGQPRTSSVTSGATERVGPELLPLLGVLGQQPHAPRSTPSSSSRCRPPATAGRSTASRPSPAGDAHRRPCRPRPGPGRSRSASSAVRRRSSCSAKKCWNSTIPSWASRRRSSEITAPMAAIESSLQRLGRPGGRPAR